MIYAAAVGLWLFAALWTLVLLPRWTPRVRPTSADVPELRVPLRMEAAKARGWRFTRHAIAVPQPIDGWQAEHDEHIGDGRVLIERTLVDLLDVVEEIEEDAACDNDTEGSCP